MTSSSSLLGSALLLLALAAVQADPGSDLVDFELKFNEARTKVQDELDQQKAALNSSYVKLLEGLSAQYQADGDLENALQVRDELQGVENGALPEPAPKGIKPYRAKLVKALTKAETDANREFLRLEKVYIASMEKFRDAMTQSGELDEALAINNKIRAAEARVETYASTTPALNSSPSSTTTSPRPPSTSLLPVVTNSELHQPEIIDDVTLSPGLHKVASQVVVGSRKVPKGERALRGSIEIKPGTVLEGGKIYLDVGDMTADRVLFRDVGLSANLGSNFFADDCLLDNTSIIKGGGWFSGYSSKWTLDNCVIRGVFIGNENFTRRSIGLMITNCTFIDVEFPPVAYVEDSGREANEDWRTIKDCYFINCTLPYSVLLFTENCMFEKCTFVDGGKPYLGNTRVNVKVFHAGEEYVIAPYGPSKFLVEDGRNRSSKPGATLGYRLVGNHLEFE